MCPIFVIKFSGVSDLQGVKVPDFPLTLLVIVTTVLRYRAACDNEICSAGTYAAAIWWERCKTVAIASRAVGCYIVWIIDISQHKPESFVHIQLYAKFATYTVSQKSSTSYFAEYFRAELTDCKNFNGYRVRDNMRTQVCNQCFNFNVPKCCHLAN